MKKKSQPLPNQDQSESSIPSFLDLQPHIFEARGKDIYLGGNKVESTLRSVLRDEAENLKTTRLWEILNASILNEAYNLALIQSKSFESVQFAKALHHWAHFMLNVVHTLSKND